MAQESPIPDTHARLKSVIAGQKVLLAVFIPAFILAALCSRVLIINPFANRSLTDADRARMLVEGLIFAEESEHEIGPDVMLESARQQYFSLVGNVLGTGLGDDKAPIVGEYERIARSTMKQGELTKQQFVANARKAARLAMLLTYDLDEQACRELYESYSPPVLTDEEFRFADKSIRNLVSANDELAGHLAADSEPLDVRTVIRTCIHTRTNSVIHLVWHKRIQKTTEGRALTTQYKSELARSIELASAFSDRLSAGRQTETKWGPVRSKEIADEILKSMNRRQERYNLIQEDSGVFFSALIDETEQLVQSDED